jgi:glycogen debranching enzyme
MGPSRQVYLLPLKDDGSPDVPGGYIYLPPPGDEGYVLRFIIEGTSSICRQGSLWVNIPEEGKAFERHSFREFRYNCSFSVERTRFRRGHR